ncbi:hypothetical protein RRG08_049478 [Elysia crispata]|uniref:Uncharacterized protein n=1 Tax=Elysia crispata TaxID=231223 RepID=A0AAE1DL86_9GAST|nr:hypothetical protein RRG08_049478 [Elysia crispata]
MGWRRKKRPVAADLWGETGDLHPSDSRGQPELDGFVSILGADFNRSGFAGLALHAQRQFTGVPERVTRSDHGHVTFIRAVHWSTGVSTTFWPWSYLTFIHAESLW